MFYFFSFVPAFESDEFDYYYLYTNMDKSKITLLWTTEMKIHVESTIISLNCSRLTKSCGNNSGRWLFVEKLKIKIEWLSEWFLSNWIYGVPIYPSWIIIIHWAIQLCTVFVGVLSEIIPWEFSIVQQSMRKSQRIQTIQHRKKNLSLSIDLHTLKT